eukprot:291895_1
MTPSRCTFFMFILHYVMQSRTVAQVWSDSMNSYPSDWTSTSRAKLVASSSCIASSTCWVIQASGEIIHTIDTTNYEDLKFTFTVNTNLGNNEYCQLHYRASSSSSWTLLSQYTGTSTSGPKTVSFPSSARNTNIEIRFSNTGNQMFANKDTDSCWLDAMSVSGNVIVVPTTSTTTKTPTTKAPTPKPTSPTTKYTTAKPITASPTPCLYTGRREHLCSDYDPYSTIDVFSSWGAFGIWISIAVCIALTCFGCGGCTHAGYFVMKDVILALFSVETTGIIEHKFHKTHRRQRRGSRSGSYKTYTFWIQYKYIGPYNKEYRDTRKILEMTDWSSLQIGHHIAVKYLPLIPCCNKKEHGGYGGMGYCSPLAVWCSFAVLAGGLTGTAIFLGSLSMRNIVELSILTVGCTLLLFACPCMAYYALKDCAKSGKGPPGPAPGPTEISANRAVHVMTSLKAHELKI